MDAVEILDIFFKVILTVSLHGLFISAIIQSRYTKTVNFFLWGVVALIIGGVVTWEHIKYLGSFEAGKGLLSFLTTLVLVTVVSFLISKDSFPKKIFLFMIVLNLFIAVMALSIIISRYIPGATASTPFYLQSLLYFLIIILYIIFFKKSINNFKLPDAKKWWSLALALFLFALVMLGKIYVYDDIGYFDLGDDILMCSLIVFGIAFFILVFDTIGNINKGAEVEQSKLLASMYAAKLKALRENENTYKQLIHDRQHHVAVLLDLVKKEDKSKVITYLENLLDDSSIVEVKNYCDNEIVNSVVSAYSIKAKQNNINFSVSAIVPSEVRIKPHDLVVLLSNLLENALNGALESNAARKEIILRVFFDKQKFYITCRNSCKSFILFNNGLPYSKNLTGMGIPSIVNTVKKYNGEVKFMAEYGSFLASIVM